MFTRRKILGGALLISGLLAPLSSKKIEVPSSDLSPGDDVGDALNNKISHMARRGGGVLQLRDGVYGTRVPIKLYGGIELVGSGKTIIRATAPIGNSKAMRSLIETPEGERGCGLVDLTLDCADNVSFAAWRAVAPRGLRCEKVNVIGWCFGLYFISTGEASAQDVYIGDTVIRNGGSRQVYPAFFSSTTGGQPFRRLTIERLEIVGSGGAYSRNNAATADQLALQNVHGFSLKDVVSRNGGENGVVIVRGSRDGVLNNITISGSDGHGLQIGGGGARATIEDSNFLTKGMEVQGRQSGAHARVDQVRGNQVWLSRLTQRQLISGEELWSAGGHSVIRDIEFCRNISVFGLTAYNNGLNLANVRGLFADLYISHAEDIEIEGANLESRPSVVPVLINNSRRVPCELISRSNIIKARQTGRVNCAH